MHHSGTTDSEVVNYGYKSSFAAIPVLGAYIQSGSPFVDKTSLIHDLLKTPSLPHLLTRPRRFGKTLLLDTISNIANGHKELFANMAIGQDELGYDWHHFPIIRIDMSNVSSEPKLFDESIMEILDEIAESHGVTIPKNSPANAFSRLITRVSNNHESYVFPNNSGPKTYDHQNVVLLIDEYDFPLTNMIGDNYKTEAIRSGLHKFFSAVKSGLSLCRFVFITGVTRFDQLSPLSGMNNMRNITFNERYSTICGFTIQEIELTYKNYLNPILKYMKSQNRMEPDSTVADLLKKIEDWYDGYSWDGKTKVLNPYSVAKCLSERVFDNYWYKSGTSTFIHRLGLASNSYFKHFLNNLSMSDSPLELNSVGVASSSDSNSLADDNQILLDAGYLAIDSIDEKSIPREFSLKIPNNEIKNSIFNQFINRMQFPEIIPNIQSYVNERYKHFYDSFCSLDVENPKSYSSRLFLPRHSLKPLMKSGFFASCFFSA
jgi:hypothetical protein